MNDTHTHYSVPFCNLNTYLQILSIELSTEGLIDAYYTLQFCLVYCLDCPRKTPLPSSIYICNYNYIKSLKFLKMCYCKKYWYQKNWRKRSRICLKHTILCTTNVYLSISFPPYFWRKYLLKWMSVFKQTLLSFFLFNYAKIENI